ncbi:MAG: HEPN domain-containing protein [Chitinivibrionales bacterium]|nr:HEPN domain-containing protein [Chitinivibrionales bacterium]
MASDTIHFSDEIFGFHAEQAVEKALKAWVAIRGGKYPFTHDLSLLLNELRKSGVAIDQWLDILELTSFGVQFRYEELDACDEPIDRPAMISRIRQLFACVDSEINGASKPGNTPNEPSGS